MADPLGILMPAGQIVAVKNPVKPRLELRLGLIGPLQRVPRQRDGQPTDQHDGRREQQPVTDHGATPWDDFEVFGAECNASQAPGANAVEPDR